MGINLPKGVEAPKLTQLKTETPQAKPAEKPANQPQVQPQVQPVKVTPAVNPYVQKPANSDQGYIDPFRDLKKNQPILSNGKISVPYFFSFFYFLVLMILMAAAFFIPMISNAAYQADPSIPQEALENWLSGTALGPKFEGLVSIFDIVIAQVKTVIAGGGGAMSIVAIAGQYYAVVIYAIILIVEVIWFTIKFIHVDIASIFCVSRKHKIIDNFYFKHTHQYYNLGILEFDFTFIAAMIFNGFIWLSLNIDSILGKFGVSNPVALFKAFANAPDAMFNFGSIVFLCIVGLTILARILNRATVRGLSRRVKKNYVVKVDYKALKKLAKQG